MRFFLAASLLLAATAANATPAPQAAPPAPKTARATAPATVPSPAADVTKMHTDDCARARAQNKTCVLDIGGEDVTGDAPGAHGIGVTVIETTQASSLIHIRRDFIVEILKSAEDLQ